MQNKNLSLPIAIIIAGIIIGAGLYFGNKNNSTGQNTQNSPQPTQNQDMGPWAITEKDHVLGNPDAAITMFVYSDLECPYCRRFHATLKQIIDEYAKTGKVRVIFRHFPLSSIHPNALKFAMSSECASEIAGKEKFWDFIEKLSDIEPQDYSKVADDLSIDKSKLEECINSNKYEQKVKSDYQNGMLAGVQGTPHSILMLKSGDKFPISGALPFEDFKTTFDQLLQQQ